MFSRNCVDIKWDLFIELFYILLLGNGDIFIQQMTMNNETKKFTDEELTSIKDLQQKYQEKLVFFGHLSLERMSIEQSIKELNEAETNAREEYQSLQKEEEKMIETLSSKYGDGSLSLKDGTFTPSSK